MAEDEEVVLSSVLPKTISEAKLKWIQKRSLEDCHAIGVDSIVFSEKPMIRVFITRENHRLFRNKTGEFFSVGFHPHHCDVALTVLMGTPYNVTMDLAERGEETAKNFDRYLWESPIGKKTPGKFTSTQSSERFRIFSLPFTRVGLPAQVLHTIYVPRFMIAAWLVEEGREDPEYIPECWSNNDLNNHSLDGLYQKMTKYTLLSHLSTLGVAVEESS